VSTDQIFFRSQTKFPLLIDDDQIGIFATINPYEAENDDLKKLKERVI
jgi:hypothetical protein